MIARAFEILSVTLLVVAVCLCMLMGSGASVVGRTAFEVAAALAFTSSVVAMVLQGEIRLLKSPLLIVPIAILILGLVQVVPVSDEVERTLEGKWRDPPTGKGTLSAARHATIQFLWLTGALTMLMFVAAHQMRTLARLRGTAVCWLLLLTVSSVVGLFQYSSNNRKLLGVVSVENRDLPIALRDTYRRDTSIGITSYQPYRESHERAKVRGPLQSIWFAPRTVAEPLFAGFLHPLHWVACYAALVPVLLVLALQRAKQTGLKGWMVLSQPEGRWAAVVQLILLGLGGIAAWVADPVSLFATFTVCTVFMFLFVPGVRGRAVASLASLLAVVALVGGFHLWRTGGISVLTERWNQRLGENLTLVEVWRDHFFAGCGLGTLGEVWPLYRTNSPDVPYSVSSLLALVCESGITGVVLLATIPLLILYQWLRTGRRLASEEKILAGGLVSGLLCLILCAFTGPGMESPVLLAIGAVLMGAAARSLAGGVAIWPEGSET